MNESRHTGLLRLRHLLEATEATAEQMEAERQRFKDLADERAAPRVASAFNLFQTPEPLADRLAAMLEPLDGRLVLEPSAGLGRLYRAVRYRSGCRVVLVEIAPSCCAELYREISGDDAAQLIQADFLECGAGRLGGLLDAVIMNPPFKQGLDIRHINHARQLLAPGGRLVAVCADGPRQRRALMPEADEWHELPADTFRREGTAVRAAVAVFDN